MKTINVTFTDSEIEELQKVKGKTPWRKFILHLREWHDDTESEKEAKN